jgi:hypothetical protein
MRAARELRSHTTNSLCIRELRSHTTSNSKPPVYLAFKAVAGGPLSCVSAARAPHVYVAVCMLGVAAGRTSSTPPVHPTPVHLPLVTTALVCTMACSARA